MTTISPTLVQRLGTGRSLKAWREQMIALGALGIVAAINESHLSVRRVCDEYFTYDNYLAVKQQRLSTDVRRLFEIGMELEDVMELSPESLDSSFREIAQLATKILRSKCGRSASGR